MQLADLEVQFQIDYQTSANQRLYIHHDFHFCIAAAQTVLHLNLVKYNNFSLKIYSFLHFNLKFSPKKKDRDLNHLFTESISPHHPTNEAVFILQNKDV